MKAPELPANETQRLEKLRQYEVLDTAPESAFDDLTRLAAYVAGVPIALVSLIDADRQWFKSRYGLEAPETPRDVSFCGHVVATGAAMTVSDALADPRFADNPLVTGGPQIRFYAGTPLITPDGFALGTLCTIDVRARQLSPEQDALLQVLARQVVDQLERRRQALELQSQQAQLARNLQQISEVASLLRGILENANVAVIETTPGGTIRVFNAAAERMLGYRAQEMVGQLSPAILHDPAEVAARAIELSAELGVAVEAGFDAFVAKARRGKADEGEWTYIRKDGSRFPVLLSVTARRDARGEIAGYLGIASDISERKRVERLQSEFVSTVSHELRTPLTSIRGALGLVAGGVTGELPVEAKEYVDIALTNSDRLVRLINDILDIDKIQSDSVSFCITTFPVGAAVKQSIAANAAFAEQYGVRLALSGEPPEGDMLADSDRLAQVLANLISNAAKFSPANTTVEVSVTGRGSWVRVSVRDHGPGIPEEFQERIFQRFAQADGSNTRQRGGTGLGLSIAKAIIEKMGGQIGFEPAPGGGSAFFFDLPYLTAVGAATPAGDGAGRILVCEDDPDLARVLERLLVRHGFSVDLSPTIERTRRLLASKHYEAMTLDLLLADGHAGVLVPEIRATRATRRLPIIVVSGSDAPVGAVASMLDDVIAEPFEETRLIAAITRAVAASRRQPPST